MTIPKMLSEKFQPNVRDKAKARAKELKEHIDDFIAAKKTIDTGFSIREDSERIKARILELFNASESDWDDWHWQIKNRITDAHTLAKIISLTKREMASINTVEKSYRWAISPYYATLMSPTNPWGPIRRQARPSILELYDCSGLEDPTSEETTSPVERVVRRYPDRLIINTTNQCAMFCRHCQRRRNIGLSDRHATISELKAALAYIRANKEIRDVVITGGDPLVLSDTTIDWLLSELHSIDHVEIKRIGTRTIVTMPQRITDEFAEIISRYPPIYINTQFNHPREVTPQAAEACEKLVRAGAIISNQAVLLKGVNNDANVMKVLNQELLKIRVRPYYLFQAKQVRGTSHFITSIQEGIDIMRKLRGYTSGLAVPQYIVSAPGGLGKVSVSDTTILDAGQGEYFLKTWEGNIVHYSDA